jgi:putative methyltransferase (TIGR04325 family)
MKKQYKKLIKDLAPPILWRACRWLKGSDVTFSGLYSSWAEASKNATGYHSEVILQKVKEASLQVKAGNAAYERDSVLFTKIEYSYPVLAGLLGAALANSGKLSVLDFGGSLGSSYYQSRSFLGDLKERRWSIVEQPNFVACGRELFADEELRFYYDIEECLAHEKPNVALLSGVIQYIEEPYKLLENLSSRNFPYMIIDRTPFSDSGHDLLTVQRVSPDIYNASYPSWIFNFGNFCQFLAKHYSMVGDFAALDGVIESGLIVVQYLGVIFRKNAN